VRCMGIDPSRKPKVEGDGNRKSGTLVISIQVVACQRGPRSEALWMPSENTINWRWTA
jgi:hypothetical protein